jgi:TetR/AcrR family transcriptional repressor of nem operon
MNKGKADNARDKLIAAGTTLIRKQGCVATTVDEICTAAGVTKVAFFHHFQTKEQLGEMCLKQWGQFGTVRSPLEVAS